MFNRFILSTEGSYMKKLVLLLAVSGFACSAFAKTTDVAFDSSNMQCGKHKIADGVNKDKLKDMKCKNYQDKTTDVLFIDDHSHKLVDCKVDQHGNVTLAECKQA
jgi:hypothetical protein